MASCNRSCSALALVAGWSLSLSSVFAGTAVWTGASGAWSDPANWRDGLLPQAGDTVYVSNTEADVTINVDADDVSIASIRFEGAGPVGITGNALTLTGGFTIRCVSGLVNVLDFPNCVAGFLSLVDVDCDVPLVFAQSGACGICAAYATIDFRRRISCTSTGYFNAHSGSQQSKLGTLNFHGPVEAPNASFRPYQHPTGYANFYGPVVFANFSNFGWSGENAYFHSTGNVFARLTLDYANRTIAMVPDAYPSNLVVSLGNTNTANENAGIFNLGNFDTVIDRLDGDMTDSGGNNLYVGKTSTCGIVRSTAVIDGAGASAPVKLTMNATANALSAFKVMDKVSLVWNPSGDYSLTMTGRVHTTTGDIDVRRGAFRMAGESSFANVPSITLGDGARFVQASTLANALAGLQSLTLGAGARAEFATAVESCPKAVVTLEVGAKLALPAGTELRVAAVCVNGTYVANGEHSGEEWIDGAGRVVVDAGTIAFWKEGVDGNWSDPAMWSSGVVPGAGCTRVCITAPSATPYVVTVDQPIGALASDLDVRNVGGGLATLRLAADMTVTQSTVTVSAGGLIDVPEGTTFTYIGPEMRYSGGYPVSASSYSAEEKHDIVIRDGGEWRTSGGTTVITNFCGSFQVSGSSAAAEGRFTMSSGRVLFMNISSSSPLTVFPNGRVDFTGGSFLLPHNGYNHLTDLANCGGVMRFKDTEVDTSGKFSHSVGGSIVMGTGETRFEGTAVLKVAGGSKSLKPNGAGETAVLTFADGATLPDHNRNSPYIACGDKGRAVINWNSGDSDKNVAMVIGANNGYGELNVNSGTLKAHSIGMRVGAYDSGTSSLNGIFGTACGQVTVNEGATLHVEGSLNEGWNAAKNFSGLVVGEGMGDGLAKVSDRYVYDGRVDVFGAFTENTGNAAIGLGRAKGTFVLHGGSATFQKSTEWSMSGQTVVGMGGGLGRVIVSNGVFETQNGNLYVGGCPMNELYVYKNDSTHARVPWVGTATYPADLRDADGRVTVVGGEVKVRNATILGKDGAGMIEMVGSAGSFTTMDLELNDASSSTLRYVLDETGVSPVKVTGSLTISEGAALELDIRSYPGAARTFKVLNTAGASVEGDFNLENVTVIGAKPGERVKLRTNADGISVTVSGGSMMIVR